MKRKIVLIMLCSFLVGACGSQPTTTPEFQPTATHRPTLTATGTPLPLATATRTPLPEDLYEALQQTYKAISFVQADAELLNEMARRVNEGKVTDLESFEVILALTAVMEVLDQAIPEFEPPALLLEAWEQAVKIHEQCKGIMDRWNNGEIDSAQVLSEMPPILLHAEAVAISAETTLASEYDFDASEMTQARQDIIEKIPETLDASPGTGQ